jgi:hypothetical protein
VKEWAHGPRLAKEGLHGGPVAALRRVWGLEVSWDGLAREEGSSDGWRARARAQGGNNIMWYSPPRAPKMPAASRATGLKCLSFDWLIWLYMRLG